MISWTENDKTLSSSVEELLVKAFSQAVVEREEVEREATPGTEPHRRAAPLAYTGGRPLLDAVDDLYDDDDAVCFLKRLCGRTRYMTDV
jgi:hypothetical protein